MTKKVNLHNRIKRGKTGIANSSHVLNLPEIIKERERLQTEQEMTAFSKFFSSFGQKPKTPKTPKIRKIKQVSQPVVAPVVNKNITKIDKDKFWSNFKQETEVSEYKILTKKENNEPRNQEDKKTNNQEIKNLIEQESSEIKKQEIKKLKNQENKKTNNQEQEHKASSSVLRAGPICPFRLSYSVANILFFLLFAAIFILPIKGMAYINSLQQQAASIMDYAGSGADDLQKIKSNGWVTDFSQLAGSFDQAKTSFSLANQEVGEINSLSQLLIKIVPKIGGTFSSGEQVLILGEKVSSAGKALSAGLAPFQAGGVSLLSEKLTVFQENLIVALRDLRSANEAAEKIEVSNLPEEYRSSIKNIQEVLPKILPHLEKLSDYTGVIRKIIGQNQLKRYLLVFQNNNEIRASGGFAGSYALMDINNGQITNLEIPAGGSYDLQAGETQNITSPHPLWLINSQWHFWDANWFFDFPTSAEKLLEFYNNSGGPTVDGVLAINATFMQDLVNSLGPIKVDGFDYEVTGDNFIDILQKESEEKKTEVQPKKFLSLVGPVLVEKLLNNQNNLLDLLPVLTKGWRQKDLQFYFNSYDLQKEIIDLGWSGRILDTNKDYLAVVHSNLSGGKTDQVIKTEIWHKAHILENGEVEDSLIITRNHQGQVGNTFTGVDNNDYLRVYVPLGSELLSARGWSEMPADKFQAEADGYESDKLIKKIEDNTHVDQSGTEIFTESNKTVFASWLHLEPGQTKSIYLKYRLPFTVKKSNTIDSSSSLVDKIKLILNPGIIAIKQSEQVNYYSLLVQKQSGANNTTLVNSIDYPENYQSFWSYPEDWKDSGKVSDDLDSDRLEVMMFE